VTVPRQGRCSTDAQTLPELSRLPHFPTIIHSAGIPEVSSQLWNGSTSSHSSSGYLISRRKDAAATLCGVCLEKLRNGTRLVVIIAPSDRTRLRDCNATRALVVYDDRGHINI